MALRKRWTRLLPGAALALTALSAAACTSAPASPAAAAAPSGAAGSGTPAVTSAQARQAFDAYLAATATAGKTGNHGLALSVVTGVQQAEVATQIKTGSYGNRTFSSSRSAYRSSSRITPVFGQYAYGKPTFLLPEQAGYPHWFVADLTRTVKDPQPGQRATMLVGSALVPVNGRILMLFEQTSAGAPWKLASTSALTDAGSMPRLARDSAGYIPAVKLSATSLLARPDVTGPLQAAVVDDGPASAASRAVAAGPLTTGMYQGARSHAQGLRPPAGDLYQWHLEGSNLAKFAFRTADGGALVFYAMYLNTVIAVPAYLSKGYPVNPGRAIKYPPELAPWLATAAIPRISLERQDLLSFAAVDPPAAPAKIQVIAAGGTLNYATAS